MALLLDVASGAYRLDPFALHDVADAATIVDGCRDLGVSLANA
jgi:hypothetical protein